MSVDQFNNNNICYYSFRSPVALADGPTMVKVNFFLRSISKIDDYKMVSFGPMLASTQCKCKENP